MDRRQFFGSSLIAGIGLTGAGITQASAKTTAELDKRKDAKLRISCQLAPAPGKTIEEKLAAMKKYGCEAVEYSGNVVGKGKEFKKLADDAGLKVSAICWGSHNGDLCKEDTGRIQFVKDALKAALETAGELEAQGVIYVPAFANQTTLSNQEIRKRCLDFLPEVGEFAVKNKTFIILEPLCRFEAFFLRQVADGASIARDCGGLAKGVSVMGDFYHMDTEETNNMGAFISAGELLKHVHLAGGRAEPRRTFPGQNNLSFVEGFRGLKYIGYQGFCSFECGCAGDKAVEFPKSIEFLKKQWDEA
ncbi:MAG: sugar phosphate isomerase/epimerase family protein [Planctomycetia bacterium]|nr:sugar phosphate isomerase/epimerase family protein [Planctomycetia bacterium]